MSATVAVLANNSFGSALTENISPNAPEVFLGTITILPIALPKR